METAGFSGLEGPVFTGTAEFPKLCGDETTSLRNVKIQQENLRLPRESVTLAIPLKSSRSALLD
jgi:hypothetical protein